MCDTEENLTDEKLIRLFRSGDDKAVEKLLVRYKNRVLSIARRFFLSGGETEDLVQEGMCGLYSAITSFSGDAGFSSYATACIKNRILDAVKKSRGNKNIALNASSSIDGDDRRIFEEIINPEDAIIDDENSREFFVKIKSILSPLEYKAINMYIEGAPMSEISAALNKSYKQTDNAITRAKRKLQDLSER